MKYWCHRVTERQSPPRCRAWWSCRWSWWRASSWCRCSGTSWWWCPSCVSASSASRPTCSSWPSPSPTSSSPSWWCRVSQKLQIHTHTQFKEVTTTLKASNSYLEGVVQIRHHHIKGNWNLSLTLPRSDWLFLSRRAPAGGGGRLAAASGAVRGLGVRRCVPLHLLHPLPHSNLHRSILILIIKQPQDDLISHQCLFSNQENMNS